MGRGKYWYICIVANVSNKLVASVFKVAQEDCLQEGRRELVELSVSYIPTYTTTYLRTWKSSSKKLTHWNTQSSVRRFEPLMPLLLILAFCQ